MRRALTSVFGMTVVLSGATAWADWPATIASDNPAHWYRFEETSGDVAVDEGSLGVNGTYVGGVGLGECGLVGRAARFDGVDDYVDVGLSDLGGLWTAEFIVWADTVNGSVSQAVLGSSTAALKIEQWDSTEMIGYTRFGVVDVTLNAPTPPTFAHVVFVRSDSAVTLFVDGVPVDSRSTLIPLGRDLLAGSFLRKSGEIVDPLNGAIDELVIFDRALSDEDVMRHFLSIGILSHGDFDLLNVGTRPDCDGDAGACSWFFGTSYVQAGVCEAAADQFTIATTDSFDPGAPGNSLRLNVVNDPDSDIHLPNRFNRAVGEKDPVSVSFDIWVAPGGAGGTVYVGGDHGGGGFSAASDRGPELSWNADGSITAADGSGNQTVVANYNFGEWQSVRFDVDMVADTYDIRWGPRGGALTLVGDDLTFRSGTQDFLDRFTFANVGAQMPDSESFLDNVTVTVGGEDCNPCDMDCDEDVDAFDIEPFLDLLFDPNVQPCCGNRGEAGSTGDTDGDGDIDAFDIEPFLECLFP